MFKAIRNFRNRSRFVRACRTGDLDAAVAAGEAMLAAVPDDHRLQNDVGSLLLDAGRPIEAERCFRRAVELAENAIQVNNLGRALLAQGRTDQARQAFKRAAELDPSDPQPQYNTVVLLREQGDGDAAAKALDQFVSQFPDHAGGQNDLGCTCEERGDVARALDHFLRATQLAPGFMPAHLNRIRLLCESGRYPEATPHLEALAAAGMRVRVSAKGDSVEIDIDGAPFYRGPVRTLDRTDR
jgi:tetratricopeptide (TPR) repeat protein